MIHVAAGIEIDERLISESFVRADGPGGQNVNKVATAVELRFDVARSSLPYDVRGRLARLAGRRLTGDGMLVMHARAHRTQAGNRRDAMERLLDLLRRSAAAPRKRISTKKTAGSKRRLAEAKRKRSQVKKLRGAVGED